MSGRQTGSQYFPHSVSEPPYHRGVEATKFSEYNVQIPLAQPEHRQLKTRADMVPEPRGTSACWWHWRGSDSQEKGLRRQQAKTIKQSPGKGEVPLGAIKPSH